MKIKHVLLIFLIGLLFGVGVSPFANIRPQQALKSPIPVTLAHMPQVISSPTPQVLGAEDTSEVVPPAEGTPSALTGVINEQEKSFADLLENSEKQDEPTKEENIQETFTQNPIKKTITIATFGDSMVDTMGTGLPYLEKALKNYYPNVDFVLHNYGIGAQNVEQGLARVNQTYSYQDRNYQPLTNSGAAHIVIIGSFAYNPFPDHDINYHWAKLAELTNQIKNSGKTVLLLAENAPARAEFGQGPNGINWPSDMAFKHAETIGQYLESTTKLAANLQVPLVDGYHPTLLANSEGNQTYINQGDHIHPNVAGHQFLAQKIAEKIYQLDLIK